MAEGMKLTRAGLRMIAKALTGQELKFTRGCVGDGVLQEGVNILDMTDLIATKRDLPIQSIEVSNTAGVAQIILEVNNQGLERGFFLREYGIFAEDPDTHEELLYAYRNVGDDASYLPGIDGPDVVWYTLSLSVVIDQAENVTAVVVTNDNYVTHSRLETRVNGLFAEPDTINYFWTHKQDDYQKLRPATVQTVKDLLVGKYDPDNVNGRLEVVENAIMQMLLTLEGVKLYPDYMNFIIEDFNDTSQIDMSKVKVTSIITQDDSVDVEDISGLMPGAGYMLTDGISSEYVTIKSVNRESGVNRVILTEPVKKSYITANTEMYRSSAVINEGSAGGTVSVKQTSWRPNIFWEGISSEQVIDIDLAPSVNQINNYVLDSEISINSQGYFQLG